MAVSSIKKKPVKKITKKTNRKVTKKTNRKQIKKVGGKLINDLSKYSKEIQKYISAHPEQTQMLLEQAKGFIPGHQEPQYIPEPVYVKPWFKFW